MEKLERLGCSKSVVGLVVPTGYSFNLDGTNIYMTLATLFIAQALGFDLSYRPADDHPGGRDADLEGSLRRHRRGVHHACGDAGRRRSALVPGMAIVLRHRQVHERMSARSPTFAAMASPCVVVSAWEGELDHAKLHARLNKEIDPVGRGDGHHHGLAGAWNQQRTVKSADAEEGPNLVEIGELAIASSSSGAENGSPKKRIVSSGERPGGYPRGSLYSCLRHRQEKSIRRARGHASGGEDWRCASSIRQTRWISRIILKQGGQTAGHRELWRLLRTIFDERAEPDDDRIRSGIRGSV